MCQTQIASFSRRDDKNCTCINFFDVINAFCMRSKQVAKIMASNTKLKVQMTVFAESCFRNSTNCTRGSNDP